MTGLENCSNTQQLGFNRVRGTQTEDKMLNSTGDPPDNSSATRTPSVEQVLVPVLDTLILMLGVTGHTMVMVIVCGRWRRGAGRTRQTSQSSPTGAGTDILLVALSAADLLLLSTIPFQTAAIAMQKWPFGNAMCRLVSFLGSACSSASIFTLATLAVTRYLTVVKPATAYRLLTPRRVSALAVLLWVPACCLGAPQLVFRTVRTPQTSPESFACFAFMSQRDQLIYGLLHFLMAFLLPLVTIAVAYGSIYVFLCRSQHAGRAPQVERYQSKVTQTTAMLVLAFTLSWLPSYSLTLTLLADQSTGATGALPRYGAFSVFARFMGTTSTVINPILYVLMSQKFRQDLLGIFKRDRQRANTTVALSAA
ncbi:mu-type opioid receptor [Nothobranchius furzeri]|uniref:Delta-type opioid receptor-like n=1 Tax=Nothobranchius furzeri TaxID=105023 RepID=A0A9D2XTZ2_NOTFU|nr:delta-type opioid receptor-like [Nothobranchius furzeri]